MRLVPILAAVLAVFCLAERAAAADMGVPRTGPQMVDRGTTACADPRYLNQIVERFDWVQRETWDNDARLIGISDIREVTYKPHQQGNYAPKVYCLATAQVASAAYGPAHAASAKTGLPLYEPAEPGAVPVQVRNHKLSFILTEEGGFVGRSPGIEFCVAGYDWFNLHEPSCRVLNPY